MGCHKKTGFKRAKIIPRHYIYTIHSSLRSFEGAGGGGRDKIGMAGNAFKERSRLNLFRFTGFVEILQEYTGPFLYFVKKKKESGGGGCDLPSPEYYYHQLTSYLTADNEKRINHPNYVSGQLHTIIL